MDTSRFDFETTTNTSLDKILNLEQSLKLFQAQVNRKLDLMEQIFLSRNEQLERQRRLLDREQAFYKSLLQNWKVSVESIIDSRHEDNSTTTINQHFQNVNLKTEVLSGTEEVDFDIEDDWGNGAGPYLDTDLDLGSDPEYNPNKSRRTLSSNANRRRHGRKRKIPLRKSISNELDEDQSGDGQKNNTNTRRRSRTRKSFVWEYFQQVPDSHFAVCSICNAKLAMVDGSTGGMISHLKRKHSLSIPTKPNNTPCTNMEVEVVNEEGGESSDAPKPKKPFIAPPAAAFPNPIPIAKPRAKKSFVWKYFTFLENENCAVCTFCNFKRTLKDGSTGGMIQHLKRKHFILNDNSIPPSSPTQFWDYFDKISGDGECSSAMCRECLTIIPMPGSNPSTLTQHLKIAHDIGIFNQEDEQEEPESQLEEQDEQDIN